MMLPTTYQIATALALLLLLTTSQGQEPNVTPIDEELELALAIKDQIIANLSLDDFPDLHNKQANLLRYGELTTNLKCLRLFQASDFDGDWGDLCNSNELLSRGFIWSTRSVCAPKDQWYESKRYWLLFEEPGFRGRYVMLAGERCIGRLANTGLTTLGSVLLCPLEKGVGPQKVRCQYPPEPWRRFRPFSDQEARREVQRSAQMVRQTSGSVVGAVSATVGGSTSATPTGPEFVSKPKQLNLDELTKNSLNKPQ